ncbi:MAG: M3 family oligoendopeptidase [Streptococcaceae bacterium]|nr:M3 family oligoendopeptidase [Streptococcaceae bacterium]
MKFTEFTYTRPDVELAKKTILELIEELKTAPSAQAQLEIFAKINKERNTLQTMNQVTSIRYTIDTRDEFYDAENTFWDEMKPYLDELNVELYKALLDSPYQKELEATIGTQFFSMAKLSLKTFSKDVIEDLQEENRLASSYQKLLANAKITFKDEEFSIPGIGKYLLDENQEIRKTAHEAKFKWFAENEATIDEIYDNLVKVRTKIAHKLGFKNFVELGYVRMMRTDYNAQMVEVFRKQVLEFITPAATNLYKVQQERLGFEKLAYYDEKFEYLTGNATPKGSPEWILEQGEKMYTQMSPETKEFFDFMVENDLLDLVNKDGKAGGGYCTFIPDMKAPYIFSNFNGTMGDIDVLTHEAGHAFQVYESRHIDTIELNFPTFEACEIHSMSMEFFAWPWMEEFFKEEVGKYKYSHLASAITFIPYGVTVDAFQHFVYENPNATPEERKTAWRNLEKQYLPHKDYEGCEILEKGAWWFQQGHIFMSPFYYIDYTLAQICALQFWKRMHENVDEAWADYLKICQIGGTKSFLEIVEYANLNSPFEEGTVASVIGEITDWLRKNQNVE